MTNTAPTEATLDRNLAELLQEIRVTQTGVQVLTGFLLTVPFTQVFATLDPQQRGLYLAVLAASILTTCVVMTPVAFNRVLFRHRRRQLIVDVGNVCAQVGLFLLALTLAGVGFLIADVVVGRSAGPWALGVGLLAFALMWLVAPLASDRLDPRPHNEPPAA